MNKFKYFIIMIIIITFSLETLSFLIFKFNLLEISHIPKFYMPGSHISNDEWWTEEKLWGSWHKKNSITSQKRSCYDVKYQSNEFGARDSSFKENSDNDIVLIGDSFAEGYGVNYNDTSQKHLETITGHNILNFGVSKNFGIVQYYLLYNNLANKFKHSKLIIYFLPYNDFGENNYDNWRGSKRYRPYYKKIDVNNYKIFIPEDAVKNYSSNTKKIKKLFKDYFWVSGLFINLNYNYKIYRAKKKYGKDTFSGYFESKLDQQKAAVYFIKKLVNEANIDTYLVSIPRLQDFDKLNKGENLDEVFWIKSLNSMSESNKNFTFIDLIKHPISNLEDLYLKCDGHWSPKGNRWAAEIISNKLKKN